MEQVGSHWKEFYGTRWLPLEGFLWNKLTPTGRIFMEKIGSHGKDIYGKRWLPLEGFS